MTDIPSIFRGGAEESESEKAAKKEIFTERISFVTRSLVKNNPIQQNAYVAMLAVEYLSMMYYIVRLADATSFNKVFGLIENFIDVTKNENGVQI